MKKLIIATCILIALAACGKRSTTIDVEYKGDKGHLTHESDTRKCLEQKSCD